MDNEPAIKVKAGREMIKEHGAVLHNYVACLSNVSDPNDNPFHAAFRARINRELAKHDSVDGPTKLDILRHCYYNASEESIRDAFLNVGLIGDEPPRDVISRLLSQATRKSNFKFERHHKQQLEQYLHHCKLENKEVTVREVLLHPGGTAFAIFIRIRGWPRGWGRKFGY